MKPLTTFYLLNVILLIKMSVSFAQNTDLNLDGIPIRSGEIKLTWDPIQCDDQCLGTDPIYYLAVTGTNGRVSDQFDPTQIEQYIEVDGDYAAFNFNYPLQRPTLNYGAFDFTLWVINIENELIIQSSTTVAFTNYDQIFALGGVLVMGLGTVTIIAKNLNRDYLLRQARLAAERLIRQNDARMESQRAREAARLQDACRNRHGGHF